MACVCDGDVKQGGALLAMKLWLCGEMPFLVSPHTFYLRLCSLLPLWGL